MWCVGDLRVGPGVCESAPASLGWLVARLVHDSYETPLVTRENVRSANANPLLCSRGYGCDTTRCDRYRAMRYAGVIGHAGRYESAPATIVTYIVRGWRARGPLQLGGEQLTRVA